MPTPHPRPRLIAIAWPLFVELALGIGVGLVGTALAAKVSDAAGAGFALANQVGATLFIVDAGVDTGPILAQAAQDTREAQGIASGRVRVSAPMSLGLRVLPESTTPARCRLDVAGAALAVTIITLALTHGTRILAAFGFAPRLEGYGLDAVGGITEHREVGLGGEQRRESLSDHRLVVDDDKRDRHRMHATFLHPKNLYLMNLYLMKQWGPMMRLGPMK